VPKDQQLQTPPFSVSVAINAGRDTYPVKTFRITDSDPATTAAVIAEMIRDIVEPMLENIDVAAVGASLGDTCELKSKLTKPKA
jgi:hypothetical protein